jgi:hypothetical protein
MSVNLRLYFSTSKRHSIELIAHLCSGFEAAYLKNKEKVIFMTYA